MREEWLCEDLEGRNVGWGGEEVFVQSRAAFPSRRTRSRLYGSANGDADEVRCVDGMRSAYVCNAVSGLAL